MVFVQYDYLFAVGVIFAFLDAWNIGTSLTPVREGVQVRRLSLSFA